MMERTEHAVYSDDGEAEWVGRSEQTMPDVSSGAELSPVVAAPRATEAGIPTPVASFHSDLLPQVERQRPGNADRAALAVQARVGMPSAAGTRVRMVNAVLRTRHQSTVRIRLRYSDGRVWAILSTTSVADFAKIGGHRAVLLDRLTNRGIKLSGLAMNLERNETEYNRGGEEFRARR